MTPPITASLQAIPPHKRGPKIARTIVGAFLFSAGLLTPKFLGYPWQFGAALTGFGGFIASQELVLAFVKTLAAFVRALTGQNGGPPPPMALA